MGFKGLTNAIIGFAMYLEKPRSQLFNHAIKTQSTVYMYVHVHVHVHYTHVQYMYVHVCTCTLHTCTVHPNSYTI